MKLCNYCGKEIKETKEKYQSYKGVNMEVGLWEDTKDGDCILSNFLIEEIHKKCGKEIILKLKELIKSLTKKEKKNDRISNIRTNKN